MASGLPANPSSTPEALAHQLGDLSRQTNLLTLETLTGLVPRGGAGRIDAAIDARWLADRIGISAGGAAGELAVRQAARQAAPPAAVI